jgi:hypothetical protein
MDFIRKDGTHGMEKDRRNSCLLEPGFETPQNRFGPLKVVGIRLRPQLRRYVTPKQSTANSRSGR